MMKLIFAVLVALCLSVGPSFAITIKNQDAAQQSIVLIEGTKAITMAIAANDQVNICPNGCFISFENGDHFAFAGNENIVINAGRPTFQ